MRAVTISPAETGEAPHLRGRPAAEEVKKKTYDEYLKGSIGSVRSRKQVTADGLNGRCAFVPRRASPVKRSRTHDSPIK